MKKSIIILSAILYCSSSIFAQNQPANKGKTGQKIVKATEKAMNTTAETAQNTTQISQNVQVISQNVKDIIKLFEPFKIRTKKESEISVGNGEINVQTTYTGGIVPDEGASSESQQSSDYNNNTPQSSEAPYNNSYPNENIPNNAPMPTTDYNSDGTANLGSQNNTRFGCYLDAVHGKVADDVEASADTKAIDLVFSVSERMEYCFISPIEFKSKTSVGLLYFKGSKYKKSQEFPINAWAEFSESQVAFAPISAAQFDKIQTSQQLENYVKQIQKFSGIVKTKDRLEGKVIAVRTIMDNRTTYALLLVDKHFGTNGPNSYLKVKLKVTGTDFNKDGLPD